MGRPTSVLFDGHMAIDGEYVPSPRGWVRRQVDEIQAKGTTRAVSIMGRPVVMLTMLGISGKVRKVPLMRVEHNGAYAAVASQGGSPQHPKWYANIKKHPVVDLQDDDRTWTARARELEGAERDEWWDRCVEAYPPYAEYQTKTDRLIPVLVLEAVDG